MEQGTCNFCVAPTAYPVRTGTTCANAQLEGAFHFLAHRNHGNPMKKVLLIASLALVLSACSEDGSYFSKNTVQMKSDKVGRAPI
jgi:hypothetical protein